MGAGSCGLALRGFFSLWLILTSSRCKGGSTFSTLFASSTMAVERWISGSGQHGRTKNQLRRKTKFQTHSSENLWVTSGRSEYFWWGLHRGYNFYLNRHFRDFSDPNNCETLTVHKAIMAAKSPNREHNDNTQSHHDNKPWRTAPTQ